MYKGDNKRGVSSVSGENWRQIQMCHLEFLVLFLSAVCITRYPQHTEPLSCVASLIYFGSILQRVCRDQYQPHAVITVTSLFLMKRLNFNKTSCQSKQTTTSQYSQVQGQRREVEVMVVTVDDLTRLIKEIVISPLLICWSVAALRPWWLSWLRGCFMDSETIPPAAACLVCPPHGAYLLLLGPDPQCISC